MARDSASAARNALGSVRDLCPIPGLPELREQEDRLDALKLLSGKLAHDFNNFLAPVLGYSALIKEEVDAESPVMSYASSLEQSARRTGELLDEVLVAARPQGRVRRKQADLGEVVSAKVQEWESGLPPTARITVITKIEAAPMLLDSKLWGAAIDHLLSNARLALATGGPLEVSVTRETLRRDRADDLGVIGLEHYHVCVKDGGFGMPPEVLRKALEPFFTTRPRTYGRGLGLTIVHTAARSHGGQIQIKSREDQGTQVDIWVPVQVERPEADVPVAAVGSSDDAGATPKSNKARKGKGSILIVDDDPWIIEVLQGFLKKSTFKILVATDGLEGVKSFKAHADEISLIVSDVSMPNMNGVEMALEIRKLDADLPILFMSGAPEAVKGDATFFQVASSQCKLLKKPFALKELLDLVVEMAG